MLLLMVSIIATSVDQHGGTRQLSGQTRLESLTVNVETWEMVVATGYAKRSRVEFERDICFVVDPGRNIFEVIPEKVERVDAVTLVATTGFWHYGNVRMIFDSRLQADVIEERLRAQLVRRKEKPR